MGNIFSQTRNMRFIQKCDSISDLNVVIKKLDSLSKFGNLLPSEELELYKKLGKHAMNAGLYSKADYYSAKGLYLSSKYKIVTNNGYFEMMQASSTYIQGKVKESIPGFKRALYWAQKDTNITLQITINNTYGGALVDLGEFDEAERFLKKGIALSEKNLSKHLSMYLLSSRILATSYERQNKLEKAKELFETIESTARKYNDSYSLGSILTHQADLLVKLNKHEQAKKKINEALEIVKKTKHFENIHSVLLHQASVLHAVGDYKAEAKAVHEAYEYKLKAIDYKNAKQINELETKYKLQQVKNKQIQTQQKLERESLLRKWYTFVFVSILLLGFLFFYVRNYKKQLKLKAFLREQKIESLLEGEEKERSRIAKELHDGVVQDLTVVFHNLVQVNQLEESEKENKINEILTYLKNTTTDIRNLSHQMMPIALREKGLQLALEDLFVNTFSSHSISFSFDVFNLEERLPQKIEISVYRIVQELLNNIIKHSNATEVSCILRKNKDKISLILEENGLGFNPENVRSGIGLKSFQSRIEYLEGELNFEKIDNNGGLIAYIQIPLKQVY